MKNNCGPFKSAYAEALNNYVLLINTLKCGGKYSADDLDNYHSFSKGTKPSIVLQECLSDEEIRANPLIDTMTIYGENT
jgi:hypothetical protein